MGNAIAIHTDDVMEAVRDDAGLYARVEQFFSSTFPTYNAPIPAVARGVRQRCVRADLAAAAARQAVGRNTLPRGV